MPAVAPGSKVLVTGANGYIAMWTVRKLLESGFSVRGTVRSTTKGGYITKMFQEYSSRLEIVIVPDIEVVRVIPSHILCGMLLTGWTGWSIR